MTEDRRPLTDEELLALKCGDCDGPAYPEKPVSFSPNQRFKPRSRCPRCRKRASEARRNARHTKRLPGEEARHSYTIGVIARTCGHEWIAKTTIPMGTLMSGEGKMTCPECRCGRNVEITTAADRVCKVPGCGHKLSKYNPGPLCWPCEEKARQRYLDGARSSVAA